MVGRDQDEWSGEAGRTGREWSVPGERKKNPIDEHARMANLLLVLVLAVVFCLLAYAGYHVFGPSLR